MKFTQITRNLVLVLASIGLIVPQTGVAWAAAPKSASRAIETAHVRSVSDVALTADKKLQGQIVDGQGAAKGNTVVTISTARGEVVSRVKADAHGNFATEIAKGGVYAITTNDSTVAVRVWTKGSAPPAAYDGVMIVDEPGSVIRGQGDRDMLGRVVLVGAGVAILGGIIAVAVNQHSGS